MSVTQVSVILCLWVLAAYWFGRYDSRDKAYTRAIILSMGLILVIVFLIFER